jgi:hypothetical protein
MLRTPFSAIAYHTETVTASLLVGDGCTGLRQYVLAPAAKGASQFSAPLYSLSF